MKSSSTFTPALALWLVFGVPPLAQAKEETVASPDDRIGWAAKIEFITAPSGGYTAVLSATH